MSRGSPARRSGTAWRHDHSRRPPRSATQPTLRNGRIDAKPRAFCPSSFAGDTSHGRRRDCGIRELGSDQAESVLSRCLVVESVEALRGLIAARPPLILVPTFDAEGLVAAAARVGHAVVVPQDEGDGSPRDDVSHLKPLDRQSATEAVGEAGVGHRRPGPLVSSSAP